MNQHSSELFEAAQRLKAILIGAATDGDYRDKHTRSEFQRLRVLLMSVPELRKLLPGFLRSAADLSEFRGLMQDRAKSWAGRREIIRREFEALIASLASAAGAPGDEGISAVMSRVDSAHVQDAWRKALERRATDSDGAITAARTLLETVCKHVLDQTGGSYTNKEDLPKLYRMACDNLNLAPSRQTESLFKQILGSCEAVVGGLGALRSKLGDAHGKGKDAAKAAARHAELAVNLAGAVATFLIATLEE